MSQVFISSTHCFVLSFSASGINSFIAFLASATIGIFTTIFLEIDAESISICIIFAFGADLTSVEDYSGEKFEYLKGQGYNYYCNVDSSQYFVQIRSNYFRQGRRNLDGYRMYYNPELLSDLFDAQAVFDSSRPVPVPTMG